MIFEAIRLALRSILRNKLRSILTMLGIVIGVAAVIAMVTVGQGSSRQVNASVSALASDMLVLRAGVRGPSSSGVPVRRFNARDAEALRNLPAIALVAPSVSASATLVAGSANTSGSITGTTADYLEVANWTLAAGRNITEAEARGGAAVCVIGETVRRALFGRDDPLGKQMRMRAIPCEVVGLLQAKGAGSFGQDQDDVVIAPLRLVQRRISGSSDFSAIQVGITPGYSREQATTDVQNLLRERRGIAIGGADDFTVSDMKEMASMLSSVNSVLSGMLSSVAAVSLLVGGIGIMNIMLVSVTERTREIGIRLAIGATSSQVLTQFLVEAVVLSLLGGVIGIALGLILAWGAGVYMAIPFAADPLVILLAFVFSAFVGVVFGYFPARRAAALDPIEALRHQ